MNHRSFWYCALVATGLLLSGCHADVTYRLEFHQNNTVTVLSRVAMDPQLYGLAISQDQTGDPFKVDSAKRNGWDVSQKTDDAGNHVFTESKTMSVSQLQDPQASGLPKTGGNSIAMLGSGLTKHSGIFTDTYDVDVVLPAPMPKSAEDKSNPYAAMGESMAASMVSAHLELKTPGKVKDTNGEVLSDGATRWDLALQSPTKITYAVQVVNVGHVMLALLGVLITAAAALILAKRRRGETIAPTVG